MNAKILIFFCLLGFAACQEQSDSDLPVIPEAKVVDGKITTEDGLLLGIVKGSEADKMPSVTQCTKTLQSYDKGAIIDGKLVIDGKVMGRVAQN